MIFQWVIRFWLTLYLKKNPEVTYIPCSKKKKFQPWYFQIRTKSQVDFTHLSERDRFFYIYNKLKNKNLNQMLSWVRTMREREKNSVQFFFDQLILIYDNFQSMEIVTKN